MPDPALRDTPVIFPEASTLKRFDAAERFVPIVAVPVVESVPKDPRPVVWIAPEPALIKLLFVKIPLVQVPAISMAVIAELPVLLI